MTIPNLSLKLTPLTELVSQFKQNPLLVVHPGDEQLPDGIS
jgi:hypothetical protein